MPEMNTRNVITLAALLSLPLLILTLWLTGANLGLWMGGWFVAALVYLGIFEVTINGMKTEKKVNERYPRSDTPSD